MIILLITAVGLVAWSFQLVQSALRLRESSLYLASALVALSAIGLIAVYVLMHGCMGYIVDDASLSAVKELTELSDKVRVMTL